MLRLIYTNILKIKRTPIPILIIGLPSLYAVLMMLYFYINSSVDRGQALHAFYLLMTVACLFVLSIVIAQFISIERRAGRFANLMQTGGKRVTILLGQVVFFLLILVVVEFFASIVFSFGYLLCYNQPMPLIESLSMCFDSVFYLIPPIIFYLMAAYLMDYSFTVLLAMLLTLSAVLLGTTGLGTGIWQYLPWVWSVRVQFEGAAGTLYHYNAICIVLLTTLCTGVFNRWEYGK